MEIQIPKSEIPNPEPLLRLDRVSIRFGGITALDGKALRRGYERGKSHMPPVMVTAWAAQTRMALANVLASLPYGIGFPRPSGLTRSAMFRCCAR